MLDHFRFGLMLIFSPRSGWEAINETPYSPGTLALYTLVLAFPLFIFRSLGTLLDGVSFPWFALEGLLFTLICLGASLTLGLLLIPCARFARRPVNDGHAMKLALFSSTPVWLFSFAQLLPVGLVRTTVLLLSLGHGCVLLFLGLPTLYGTEPVFTLMLSLVASALWVLGLALFTQVFLGMAFSF